MSYKNSVSLENYFVKLPMPQCKSTIFSNACVCVVRVEICIFHTVEDETFINDISRDILDFLDDDKGIHKTLSSQIFGYKSKS